MDFATNDPMRVYPDTIYVPDDAWDAGIHLLEEPPRRRAPCRTAREARAQDHRIEAEAPRERFIVTSDPRGDAAIRAVAWDERPGHFGPNSGGMRARLAPPPYAHRGGPAFPLITQSEGADNPGASHWPSGHSCPCAALAARREAFGSPQRPDGWPRISEPLIPGLPPLDVCVLLLVIVVLSAILVRERLTDRDAARSPAFILVRGAGADGAR